MKNKWILFGVAVVFIAINLLNTDFSVFQQLSPADFLPVVIVVLVSFLIKAGILSAILIGIKKLLEKIRHKK
jgi:hypothetical protein